MLLISEEILVGTEGFFLIGFFNECLLDDGLNFGVKWVRFDIAFVPIEGEEFVMNEGHDNFIPMQHKHIASMPMTICNN